MRCLSAEAVTQWVAIVNNMGREPSPLNTYLTMTAFEEYVDQYGHNFNRKLYEFAVSLMRDRNGSGIKALPKEQVTEWLKTQGVTLKNDIGYNAAYIYAMAKADYYGSSIKDNIHLALFVKDYMEDPDGNPERAFDGFVMSCRAKDEPIFWDEML